MEPFSAASVEVANGVGSPSFRYGLSLSLAALRGHRVCLLPKRQYRVIGQLHTCWYASGVEHLLLPMLFVGRSRCDDDLTGGQYFPLFWPGDTRVGSRVARLGELERQGEHYGPLCQPLVKFCDEEIVGQGAGLVSV